MSRSEFFDRVAAGDDPLLFTGEHHVKVQALKERLGDCTGLHVLEPGCGAGPLTGYLAEWVGPSGRVYAFDNSPGMLARCRQAHAHRSNVMVWQDHAESATVNAASVDLIVLFRVFPHFDDKEQVLRHLRSLLKAGGRVVIANLEGSKQLNHLHAGFGEAVQHDHMPCAYGTRRLLESCGYAVVVTDDQAEGFYAEARLDGA